MVGDVAGVLAIEPRNADAACEEAIEGRPVDVERDVEHRDADAFPCADARESADVALRAGDEIAVPQRGDSKLMHGAQPVGIAVEHAVAGHRVFRRSAWRIGDGAVDPAARRRCREPRGCQ
jgi:hypothetical protein